MTRTKITVRCYIISFIWFCQLNLITLEKFSSLKAAEAAYLSSNPNVSYEEILELPYRISDHRIRRKEQILAAREIRQKKIYKKRIFN